MIGTNLFATSGPLTFFFSTTVCLARIDVQVVGIRGLAFNGRVQDRATTPITSLNCLSVIRDACGNWPDAVDCYAAFVK